MGIFSRLRDIVNSNLNSMLDKAEDPEKMVRLIIQEMEDTLIEVKASCAGVMAEQKKVERQLEHARSYAEEWLEKSRLAVRKERDDLARAALAEKRRYEERAARLEEQLEHTRKTVSDFQSDIGELEAKLADAREKQRMIVQRQKAAVARGETQRRIRAIDTTDAFARFEAYENHIDRMEAEADLVNGFRPKGGTASLADQLGELEHETEIEEELAELKREVKGGA